nr:PREDICTED: histone-lysine N-methyltransferase 2A isoform X3 [Lepisosteus oculatus]
MAHSCRWRFPARPGGSSNAGSGRRAGRIRVTASLRTGSGPQPNASGLGPGFDAALQVSAAIGNNLQKFRDVFGEASGSSSGEEETFLGFGTHHENRRIHSSARSPTVKSRQERKPRGRPPRILTTQREATAFDSSPSPATSPHSRSEGPGRPPEKVKRPPGRPPGSGEKRRGRPPASGGHREWQPRGLSGAEDKSVALQQSLGEAPRRDLAEDEKEKKAAKRTPLGSVQQQHQQQQGVAKLSKLPRMGRISKITKIKRLRSVKLGPLKSRLKAIGRKGVPVPVVPRRRRGRPPSAERLRAQAAAASSVQVSASSAPQTALVEAASLKQKTFRVRKERDSGSPQQLKLRPSQALDALTAAGPVPQTLSAISLLSTSPPRPGSGRAVGVRQSPRRIKPVRIVPPSKRPDATIAKQLLQRAKKGAQKKKMLEKEAAAIGSQGSAGIDSGIRRRRRTQLKNIRQFIMPVVSTVSLRIIKTPKRFIEDEGSFGPPPPHLKMARLEAAPTTVASLPPSSSVPVSTAAASAAASGGAAASTSTPTPPPPPGPSVNVAAAAAAAATLLNSGSCNNSTSNGRFSSSAASCGSSAVSQHSSQLSSGESSRSSSPSLDSSSDSQASEGTQALSEEPDQSPSSQGERESGLLRVSRPPSPPSEPERGRRGRRGQGIGRGTLTSGGGGGSSGPGKKTTVSGAVVGLLSSSAQVGSQQASSTASSSSSPPPPPLLTPPLPPQHPQPGSTTTAAIAEPHPHSPWIMPHPIAPFISAPPVVSPLQEKRKSILREPTFRWTSVSRPDQQYFSSAKYAKEGLIRKPIFDNFRPPPLTPEDVGLVSPSSGGGGGGSGGSGAGAFSASGGTAGAGGRFFAPLHHHRHQHDHTPSRFEPSLHKRSPLLRAPRFTPSEAHSRIFESVTLPASKGGGQGSLSSPLQSSSSSSSSASRNQRRCRRRRVFSPLRGQPRSPSHSMTTRSSQSGTQVGKTSAELSPLAASVTSTTSSSSSLPGVAISSLATSALTPAPFSTFSPGCMGHPTEGTADSYQTCSRRQTGGLGGAGESFSSGVGVGSSPSVSSSSLFPLFATSPPATGGTGKASRERGVSASRESGPKEKEREPERPREREKENKKEARKERERKGKGAGGEAATQANSAPILFSLDAKESEEPLAPSAPKKTPGRKKPVSLDPSNEAPPSLGPPDGTSHAATTPPTTKGRLSKKGRSTEKGQEADAGEKEKEKAKGHSQAPAQQTPQPGPPSKQAPVPSLGSMLAQVEKQQVADRRVAGLLKKAKAQLYKIEKNKSLKTADQPKAQGQESDSSETSARGPRIKHVCRRAAVALGRNRAVFPDDMPTLSALPWEEREKILSSMGNDDKSSVAGSEEAEPPAPPVKPIKPVTRQKAPQEPPVKKGRRSRRCGQCPGCQVPEDCGVCTNCLDKPKFGGRNIKKQCCKVRKCQNLQWMPSKAYLQKQAKAKKEKKKTKAQEKKEPPHSAKTQSSETNQKPAPPPSREEPTPKKSETPPPKHSEQKQKQPPPRPPSPSQKEASQPPSSALPQDTKQPVAPPGGASRKERKLPQPTPPPASPHITPFPPPTPPSQHQPQQSPALSKKEGSSKTPPSELKKKQQQPSSTPSATEPVLEVKQPKKQGMRCIPPPKQKPKEKEKPASTKPESSTLNLLSTPSTGGGAKQRPPYDGVHRIRVDFKEDYDIDNVWEMGGLSVLTSVPITPRVICFLCASSGHVEFVFCQVCCEPFHLFCLDETERPLQEQWENWCCRRCRFCHVCGRQHQKTKQQLLECNKCRNSYHPECLGPNHPTRPTKKKRIWICTKCVRCKSCGSTTPGKSWDAQWSHDFSLCHDCAKLFAKGNFCPVCDKCYDDDDYESKMMQCGKCDRWVHAKCENLTDEMYEMLSNLPESIAYTCINCTERHPAEWRTALEKELQGSVRQVLTALLNSRTSTHLLRYRQPVMKPPELNPEPEESLPSRSSPEGPDPPVLTEVSPPNDSPPDLESVKRKMETGRYNAVLEFSDDIVKIIQTAINSDGGQPENKKANSMVKCFFIRQMERVFPWFKVKESRFWEPNKISSNSGLLPNAVLPPSLDHNYAQWQEREDIARAEQPPPMKKIIPAPRAKGPGDPDSPAPTPPPPPPPIRGADLSREDSPELAPPPGVSDNRQCVLCLKYGDDNTNDGGRLLYIGQNEWTHVNCALWSAEVFEDDDGSLKNVHMAVIRGKQLRCEHCQRPGATVGCCLTSCTSNYHFMCARLRHCVFLEDKKVYCQRHRDLIKGEVVSETGFEVTRRILVDFEGISLRRKFLNGLEPENIHLMIGSMTVDCLGILTELSDCERKLFPIGYQCSRVYWSTLDARKRCVYTCKILVCHPPVVEADVDSTVEREENRTIAHSPPRVTDVEMCPLPGSMAPARPADKKPLPSPQKPQAATRNRHPSYPPCHRSPSSRPLPSAGDPSPTTHEIVTVGDPLLNSGLRSIGSRRHSTSSISPQQPKQRVTSPSRGGGPLGRSGGFSSAPSLSSNPREPGSWDAESRSSGGGGGHARESGSTSPGASRKNGSSTQERKAEGGRDGVGKSAGQNSTSGAELPSLARESQVSPPVATAVLTSHRRSNSNSKTEKGKQGSTKDTAPSAGLSLASRHHSAALPKDANSSEPVKDGNSTAAVSSKDLPKPGSTPPPPPPPLPLLHHKGGVKKPREQLPMPSALPAVKTAWSSGPRPAEDTVKRSLLAAPPPGASHGIPNPKDKRSKVKAVGGKETTKEKEKTPQNSTTQTSDPSVMESVSSNAKGSGKLDPENFESPVGEKSLKCKERFPGSEKKTSSTSAPGGTQHKCGSEKGFRASQAHTETSGKEASVSQKKRTVKVTLTPLKMDPNGTKTVSSSSTTTTSTSTSSTPLGSHKKSSRSLLFSPPCMSSKGSELEAQHPQDEGVAHLLGAQHSAGDDAVFQKDSPEGTAEHALQDGSGDSSCGVKQHEDDSDSAGSVKRRYPRRSARARSNMFFGLTPFYGVRSYGEEDIPFYSSGDSSSGKKRSGGGGSKRAAEGQVDGADDMTTSSSGESGEDEEGVVGQGSDEDAYYYNFTHTIINPGRGLTPEGGIEQCLGRDSQLHGFLKEESGEEDRIGEEGGGRAMDHLGRPQIGQLDGVDDGSESDTSVNATSTAATSSTSGKTTQSTGKRKSKDSRGEKLDMGSCEDSGTGKEAENRGGGAGNNGGVSNSRDTRKSLKDGNKLENCLPLSSVKSQGQDPLEAQLTLNTELLKSDSDNTNSDDCGNILPSDIMEFVLNTPSMQALGQQPETSSTELLSLDEGFGLDGNRGKDIGLFEDFSQQLPSTEPVESGVNASIPGEEQYDLPLELPSDLSVLTTRSPSVANQNHSALIPEPPERSILSLPSEEVEKGGDKSRGATSASSETQQGGAGSGESQVTEGHMTPEHFIPTRLEGDRMTSPPIGQVVEPSSDLARSSGTPGLPSSPTIPLQGQKYMPATAESPGPTQVASTAVQTTATHLKPGTEKLIVVNQHMQPLYVFQTLPNGVTQEIQIAPSVSTTAGVMDTSSSVLASMTGGLALAPSLNPGISTSQSIFPTAGKGLVPMPHHPQIHAFAGATQTSFPTGIPSTTSSLRIGVQHSQDPQMLVSEAGHRPELAAVASSIISSSTSSSPSSVAPASGHGKKRPISRLQPRKTKKLARSGTQPTLAPSEVAPNMTLINFSPSQIPAGIQGQSRLVELGTLATAAAATSHRTVPNIIKRPKSEVSAVYFEQAPLLPQGMVAQAGQPGILGHESSAHLVPCTMSGLNPNQPVLNVVSMPTSGPGNLLGPGSVSLSTPGLLGPADITGSISNLILKATQQSLGLPEQQMVLQPGPGMISQLSGPVPTPNTSSICVLPSPQAISMPVTQPADQEGGYHLQHYPVTPLLADKPQALDHGTSANISAPTPLAPSTAAPERVRTLGTSGQSSRATPLSRASDQQQAHKTANLGAGAAASAAAPALTAAASEATGKGKVKVKRTQPSPDKGSGKKHKPMHVDSPREKQGAANAGSRDSSAPGARGPVSPEPMDIEREARKGEAPDGTMALPAQGTSALETPEEKPKATVGEPRAVGAQQKGQEQQQKDRPADRKPKKGLMFEICSDDGFQIRSESIEEAWKSLTDKVQEARSNARLKELSFEGVNGLWMLGVIHDAVVFLLEQLYGARHCRNYKFRFHKPEEADEPPINPHGAARAEVNYRRSVFDMFNFLASKHRQPPKYSPHDEEEEEVQLKSARRPTSMDLPMPMRFRHLKKTSKEAVGVYRSAIHGRGLFCKRNIDAGEMVIEYSGNVIRSVLTDKREKYYDGKGIGCYMFRIDDYEVVDATMHGNAARFINHSCEPNCYSRVINIDGQKHIVIFALRKIYRGEELTYDYKFPIEDAGNKLPCNCGAKKCRKFLN